MKHCGMCPRFKGVLKKWYRKFFSTNFMERLGKTLADDKLITTLDGLATQNNEIHEVPLRRLDGS